MRTAEFGATAQMMDPCFHSLENFPGSMEACANRLFEVFAWLFETYQQQILQHSKEMSI